MGAVTKSVLATMSGNVGSTPYYRERSYVVDNVWVPAKQSGQFITLPNGSKFRRATRLARFHASVARNSPEFRKGFSTTGQPYSVQSSPGGFDSDAPIAPPTNQGAFTGGTGCFTGFNWGPDISTPMRNEAVTKALLNISDAKAGIGEDLATFRQIVGMIHKPAKSLYEGLKEMKNDESMRKWLFDSVRSMRRHGVAKATADKYLEYVYGFKPLMGDIYGVIDLMRQQGNKNLFVVGKGSSHQSKALNPKTFNIYGPIKVNAFEDATVRCKIWSRIDPNHAGLRALNQLGLLNPVSLTWDLIPWSFVVDWFVPIGQTLQALTAPAGLIFVDGTVSAKVKCRGDFTHIDGRYPYTGVVTTESPATGTYNYEGYQRVTLDSWPLPGFWFNSDPLSGDRPLKALALAVANLKKGL